MRAASSPVIVTSVDVLGAGVERRLEQPVLVGAGRERKLPAMPEQERDRAVGAQIAAVLGECMAHVGHRARPVVGHAVDDHRSAADAVALVADLLIAHPLEVARPALDRALDGVLGHVVPGRLVDGEPQPGVHRRVAAAKARGDRDFLDQAGEDLAALRVGGGLLVLDVRPLAVASHGGSGSPSIRDGEL
jgi:hypothetical protein